MAQSTGPGSPPPRGPSKKLTWTTIAFLNVAAIASIRSLPAQAEYGLASILIYLIPVLLFFLPTAFVAAELATGWKGGIFVWVKEALSGRLGFLSIWLQWIQNVVWFPVVLAFAAGTLAYITKPDLANSGLFTAIVILAVYWIATIVALRGLNLSSLFGSWGMILGTLLPAVVLIVLGVAYLVGGDKPEVPVAVDDLVPAAGGISSFVLIVTTFLAFAGMEMNAVHARDTANPRRAFPKAMVLSVALILLIYVPPTLAIAFVVPSQDLSLTAGVMQAYDAFFRVFGIEWASTAIGALIIIGAFGGVITWVAGPSRGILLVGQHGYLPRFLQKTNRRAVQGNILGIQGVIVSALAVLYIFVPNPSSGFIMLSAMAAQLYLIMYVLMFISAMVLRKKQPNVQRGFRVPWLNFVCGVGIAASVCAFAIGFVPASQFKNFSPLVYAAVLVAGLVILGGAPLLIYAFKRDSWMPPEGVDAALGGAAGVHEDEEAGTAPAGRGNAESTTGQGDAGPS